MKAFDRWTFAIIIPLFAVIILYVDCASISNVVHIACQRNPKLKICSKPKASSSAEDFPDSEPPPLPPLMRRPLLSASKLPGNLTRSEFILIKQLATQTRRVRNPFSDEGNVLLDEDIVDFSSKEDKKVDKPSLNWHQEEEEGEEDAEVSSTSAAPTTAWHKEDDEEPDTVLTRGGNFARTPGGEAQTRVEAYCDKYQENYDYYCQDSIDKTPALKTHLLKFCPSFEANCPDKIKKKPGIRPGAGRETGAASFPIPTSALLTSEKVRTKEEFPDVLNVVKSPKEIAAEERLARLKKIRPCTPDCDARRYKHCTAECKCDYLYPHVQRFCNPPPIPFFLNTCRLWYYGCPKYQQYHYASQFVYSKADKGKTVGGVSPRIGGYGGATATGFGPGNGPLAGTNPVIAPIVAQGELTSAVRPEKAKLISKNHNNKPGDPFEAAQEDFMKEHNIRPKARQATTGAVDPAFGSSVHDFDQFSDRRGQVLRARSRSPFSKPGLWEPNPDDPHNRDHANKWYYRPSSVGADWLSGQVTWGAHWAVPAAGVGGTDGFSAVHFPTIGNFFNIADDYD